MLAEDRDALICDMAETYSVYDMRALPVETLATLACGLREDSRIKLKMAGVQYIPAFAVAVRIHDLLSQVYHDNESSTPPVLLADMLTQHAQSAEQFGYESADDYEAARARYIKD